MVINKYYCNSIVTIDYSYIMLYKWACQPYKWACQPRNTNGEDQLVLCAMLIQIIGYKYTINPYGFMTIPPNTWPFPCWFLDMAQMEWTSTQKIQRKAKSIERNGREAPWL